MLEALNKAAVEKGLSGEFNQRYDGIDWIGNDKAALTSHCDYLEKMGWFCTPLADTEVPRLLWFLQ